MSILIKGMEMPTVQQGYMTVRIYYDGTCVRPNWQGDCTVIKGAEAVNVPTPHGRLIDADDTEGAMVEKGQASKRYRIGEFWELNGAEIREALATVPTIIESEE